MKNKSFFLLFMFAVFPIIFYAQDIPLNIIEKIRSATSMENGIHQIIIAERKYEVYIKKERITTIKRIVIPESIRHNIDKSFVSLIEEAYASFLLKINNPRFTDIVFLNGNWMLLENLNNNIEFKVTYEDHRNTIISLKSENNLFSIKLPIDYLKFHSGTRTDIENDFIERLKSYNIQGCRKKTIYNIDNLKHKGKNLYILPGDHYIHSYINQDSYLSITDNDSSCFIVDSIYPVETISNMINIGIGYPAFLNITIPKHEYGEKTYIRTTLEKFIQFCMQEGCKIYWGYDSIKDSILNGTIFCYNENQGYEHLVQIKCNTTQLGDKKFEIEARAYLFIPTTNVQNIL